MPATANSLVVLVSLSNTPVLLAGSSQAAHLAVLVHRVADPVDACVAADGLVGGVDENDFEEFVGGVLRADRRAFERERDNVETKPVSKNPQSKKRMPTFAAHSISSRSIRSAYLVDPVRVQDPQVPAPLSNPLFSNALQAPLELQLVDTLATRLSVNLTLGNRSLTATTADANTVNDIALLGLVSQAAGLVGARGAGSAVDHVELAELPAAETEKEAHHVGLLLFRELFHVLVGCSAKRAGRAIPRHSS